MRVRAEYIKYEMISGVLFPSRDCYYEIIEIDNKPGDDLDKLVEDKLSKLLKLNKDRFKFMSATEI